MYLHASSVRLIWMHSWSISRLSVIETDWPLNDLSDTKELWKINLEIDDSKFYPD